MAVESSKETGEDQVEALIDDLIHDILGESGTSAEAPMRGMATAALLETAFGSARGTSRAATVERLLLAELFASELAEALAPALAEQLAPRLVKAMEQVSTEEASKPAQPGRPPSQRRRSAAKLSRPVAG